MTEIRIHRGIPPPTDSGKANNEGKYPFRQLEVGDSFFAPGVTSLPISYWKHVTGHKYTVRVDKKASGTWVWRIK